ncbi:MAG: glycoside hydrolase [Clostridiales bacterium]|nr:glycoside hydrolase [Clostridiales bacterium]
MAEEKVIFCGNDPSFLSSELISQSNESNTGTAFRIPSLIKSGDTLIAVIDKQSCGSDWGYIEIAVRTSNDGGESWSDIKTIASPPAREIKADSECFKSAFFIDPCMAIAPNGDVIMIIDFWPECRGIHSRRLLDKKKLPYTLYEKQMRPALYDRDGKFYTIRNDGTVIDSKKNETSYKVTDWNGSLYHGDTYVGNIFLNGKTNKNEDPLTTFGAPLKVPKRSYIYMLRSTDNGKTWSEPVDITNQILNKDDGVFLGVAPGVGLTTKDGRIVMPLYVDRKETVSIYSVDNGYTWHRMTKQPYSCNTDEWQLVQSPDGTLLGMGRQKRYGKTPLSVSTNDGKYWEKAGKTSLYAPKCQKSVISIGEHVFCSHASEKKRENGVITVGKFRKSKGKTIGIDWYNEVEINQGFFAYSCLVQIDDEYIGVLYEAQPSSYICFKKFKLSDLI